MRGLKPTQISPLFRPDIIRDNPSPHHLRWACLSTVQSSSRWFTIKHTDPYLIISAEPVFIVRPSAARVGLNGIAKFDCVARGNPPPSVFWTKEVICRHNIVGINNITEILNIILPLSDIETGWHFAKVIIDFLIDRSWKSLTQKYVNWQTFANARCHYRFRSIIICRIYWNNKAGKIIVLSHYHQHWCASGGCAIRAFSDFIWFKNTCVHIVCLLNKRASFKSHHSVSGNVISDM